MLTAAVWGNWPRCVEAQGKHAAPLSWADGVGAGRADADFEEIEDADGHSYPFSVWNWQNRLCQIVAVNL